MKRKAQGSIEYFFMFGLALVLIFVVIKQVLQRGTETLETARDDTITEIQQLLNETKQGAAVNG